MGSSTIPTSSVMHLLFLVFYLILFSISFASSSSPHENFLQCLSLRSNQTPPIPVYTPNTSSYSSILQSSIQNLRFASPTTPKPHLIVTPLYDSHVQAAVICSRKHWLQIIVRSGGHDYEGLSYVSDVPFFILDLANLRSVEVDVKDGTAWVQSGATIGQVYYRIGEKTKTYGFPAGICPTVGVGGHFSGGGYGVLLRKFGLAADNILDARLVNADGEILDKKSMGEDLFWAIRGGGGGSFGVVLSWKIKLVPVPPTVTVFTVSRNLEQGGAALVHRWQSIADKLSKDLFIRVIISRTNNNTITTTFQSLFLGGTNQLLQIMQQSFPELELKRKDCIEMSWVQSVLCFNWLAFDGSPYVSQNKTQTATGFFKAKSDYVKEPISETGLNLIFKRFYEVEKPTMILTPYGGRMSEIAETEIPFSHREGNIYSIQLAMFWEQEGTEASKKNIDWIRRLYRYMAPYVSKSPRAAYVNYRDLDLGKSKNGTASYTQARAWGVKYFKGNFDRLVQVKSKVDPDNFFRNEQSIPAVPT